MLLVEKSLKEYAKKGYSVKISSLVLNHGKVHISADTSGVSYYHSMVCFSFENHQFTQITEMKYP
jgi:hypothetical protein